MPYCLGKIVIGRVNNEERISNYFSPREHGMFPADILLCYKTDE